MPARQQRPELQTPLPCSERPSCWEVPRPPARPFCEAVVHGNEGRRQGSLRGMKPCLPHRRVGGSAARGHRKCRRCKLRVGASPLGVSGFHVLTSLLHANSHARGAKPGISGATLVQSGQSHTWRTRGSISAGAPHPAPFFGRTAAINRADHSAFVELSASAEERQESGLEYCCAASAPNAAETCTPKIHLRCLFVPSIYLRTRRAA